MYSRHDLPVADACQQDPGANHLTERRASFLECTTDDLNTPSGLRGGVADADGPAVGPDRCGARNGNEGSHANCPRDADFGLIRAATRYELAHRLSRIWQTTLL